MILTKFNKIKTISYKPGGAFIKNKKKIIKLSANESALGVSSKVTKLLKKNLRLSKYPDPKCINLRKKISKRFNCNFNQIICGAGSDEIIQMLCQLFIKPGDNVVLPKYSFLMYRIYSTLAGAKVIFAAEDNYKVSIKNILNKVNKNTKLVFIANPNNPTGTYLKSSELINLRKKLKKNILLVLDDAYVEYMYNKDYSSALNIFKNTKNVFILRTFSKIYGLASLRIGWGYGCKEIIDQMFRIKPPFNVNKIAELSAIESLKDKKFIQKSIKHNSFWGIKIKKDLNKYGINSNNVNANFLLLNFKNCKLSAEKVEKKLIDEGIILRETRTYGIKNCLRLTIGNKFENIIFLKKINKILKNAK